MSGSLGFYRVGAKALIVLVLAAGITACGTKGSPSSSPSGSAVKTAASKTATSRTVPTVTPRTSPTTAVRLTSTELDQTACRSFLSFSILLKETGEDGPDAAGEISGMISAVKEAQTRTPAQASGSKLLTDLSGLEARANSSQWKTSPKEASSPQMAAVAADCKAFPTSGT